MSSRKLIIFDLDETLVHATKDGLKQEHDLSVPPYFVYVRPNVGELLEYCSERFDLAVWSSSSTDYVSIVSEYLFGNRYPLKFVWSASRCVRKEDLVSGGYLFIKDLRKVRSQGYELENILIVDDSPEKVKRQPKNLIPIAPFEGDPADSALLKLIQELSRYG